MGGPGSGWRGVRKRTVEEALFISSSQFNLTRVSSGYGLGSMVWTGPMGTRVTLQYSLKRSEHAMTVRFEGTPIASVTDVSLEWTVPFFGGARCWFRCPGVAGVRSCGRRTTRLYLPIGSNVLSCRVCHRLTYESVQRHDPRVSFLRNRPGEACALLRRHPHNVSNLFLVLRALRVLS